MGSKSSPKKTTQTNKVELSPEQQQLANLGLPYAQQFASTDLQLPQTTVAGFNPNEIYGQQLALGQAMGPMTDLSQKAAASNSFLMDPSLLSPDSNPYLAAQGDAITRTMTNNLNESILPGLRAGSTIAGGMYSGGQSRAGIAEGLATGRTNQALGDALANLYSGAYNTGLSTMTSAIGQNPQVMKGLLYPSTVISGVGGQQRAMEQAQLDATNQNQWAQQMLPLLQAQQIYGLMNALPGGTGVSTVTGAQPSSNPAMSGLGGAASGAMLGSMIMPGVGTAVGAGLGGLLGLLG
jgi:hypothetical protein